MIKLELTLEERDVLVNTLDSYINDLKDEIRHTDRSEYREMLKNRLDILAKILNSLRQ